MNLRKIIREELKHDLLNEGRLNDLLSKFNISEIKKLLKDRLDIDENSSKTEVVKKLIKYYYNLNLKLLKYELGAVLGGFVFYFLSMILDIAGVEPFVTSQANPNPTTPHFILWGAGALLNLIRMVRSDKKKHIKEEIEGFDDLNWIRKVSNNPWMKYEQIIDYIVKMYKPTNIKIDTTDIFGSEETYVSLYFDEISDDYISNPQSNNIKRLKERNLSLEIRNNVYNYFGVMTSGLDLNGYSPYRYMGLTIDVHLKN